MSEDMDIEAVFNRATLSAETFGQSISQALDAYTEFARQGYKGDDLGFLADAGLVAANVGELTAQKASEYMTATMVQWGIDAENSMKTIDAWNAISNNYATTVEKLAQGQTRAGATAKALGMDFNQLNAVIGTVTAATKQSGNEVGNFWKAAAPRLFSDKGQDILASLNVNSEDAKGNLRDIIDIYTDVANAMKGMSEIEQINIVKGLGGVYHQTRLQVLLDDLGSVDSMYRSMLKTAENSEGSAMTENEKYMKSLQARINLVRVEVEKLAVGIGEAFLNDAMIGFLKTSGDVLQGITKIVDGIGVLPILFGVASMAILTFSGRAQALTGALSANAKMFYTASTASLAYSKTTNQAIIASDRLITKTNANAVATRNLAMNKNTLKNASGQMAVQMNATSSAMTATTKATTMLATAGKTLIGAFVWTLPFVALGLLTEQLTKASAKTRELRESAETANKEMMTSFKSNQDELSTLTSRYAELESVINSGKYDNTTLAEYHDIQNKIAQLMPSLVTGEDQYGNKLIETSDVIQIKLDMLKEQLNIEKEIAEWQSKQDRDTRIDGNIELAKDNTKAYNEELKNIQRRLEYIHNTGGNFDEKLSIPKLKDVEDLVKYLEKVGEQRSIAEKAGDSKAVDYYETLANAIMESQRSLNGYSLSMKSAQSLLKVDYISKLNDSLKDNNKLWGNTTNTISTFMAELMKLSDVDSVDSLNNALMSISINGSAGQEIYNLTKAFDDLNKSTNENFNSVVGKVETSMGLVKTALSGAGLSDSEIDSVMNSLNAKLDLAKAKFSDVASEMGKSGTTWEQAVANLEATGEAVDELTSSADEAKKGLEDLTDSISYINGVLEDYADSNRLSTSTVMELVEKYPQLIAYIDDEGKLIEELTKIRDKDTETARQQLADKIDMSEEYYNTNLKMIESYFSEHFKFYNGDLSNFKNLAQAKADVETELIESLAKQWSVYYSSITSDFMPKLSEWTSPNSSFVIPGVNDKSSPETDAAIKRMKEANKQLEVARNKLNNFSLSKVNLDFSSIGTSIEKASKSSKKAEKANKETTKSLKESIYVSDKYKQALEKINLEIEKQQNLQSKFAPHSEEYRKSLLAQIKLEKEKLSLFKSQSSELQKQIKSGKIAQTGIVDVSPSSTTKTTTASKKLNGWSGSTTSGFGMRMHPTLGVYKMHEGIDIAGRKGTRLDSNVNGKVVSQGYNSVSGNFVKIQDSNGFKHFYAHLDKAFVKLGDMVEAGTHIGNIGSTGRSTGSHLHYGVQNKSGKYINPADYVKSAKNNKVVTSTTSSSSEKSASTIRAEAQQALDQAKSDFNTLQQNILAQQKVIEDLEKTKLIESNLAWFDYKRNQYDDSITFESTKIEELDTNSKRYNATLENMIKFMNKKQSMNQQELKYLQSSINSGQYQGEVLDNLKDRYSALTTEMKATQIEIKKTNYEILMNIKTQSDELISDVEYQMSRAKAIQGMYEEGSGDWVELAEEEITLQKDLVKLYKQQYDQLQKEMTARSLNASEIKSMNAELQSLSVSYWNALSAEKAMTKSLEDSQKAILSNMADDIISSYKDVYSEKQDIHMESLESERRAEEKAHQARMKQIEDEMKLYRKSVQEKIDLINKQESERDYNMEVSDMEAERSSVAKKLNEVQFDNSHEGKAERKKLQEQLDKIDKDIAEKRHDRDIELQTTALNEMLELKEEESQGVQEIETARYETVISNIDRQKEYWGKYYNDIINDERKFAKLREDIMNKNFDNIEKEFGEFINELNSSLPSLEDTMDGTMGAVGTSIRVNIIDNLKRALDMLAEFESKQAVTNSHSTMGSGSVSAPTGSGKSTLSNGDLQVLLGKFMTESLANEETNASRKATIKNKAYEIASSGRSAGSSIGSSESLNSVVSKLSKEDLATLSAYISSRAGSIVSTPALQDYIRNFAKQLLSSSASLSVGGMIPRATGGIDGKGGRSVIVHPEEIISNPIDSKNMVITSSIMERIASMLTLPKLNSLISSSNGGNGVEINFNIDKMYGTEQEANGILSKINTTMKTRFGGGL